ncbi:WG repeat-containing protein [uncultured Tenacibaculum sp.]|uniref:WG repeat-containing protein n=1 Tax=uncultured Tenacibaculum sp. TaxID=174713 RepID=UPI00261D1D46|nr:WG repeat-containing protein [uncultured Tenacibaculum sp.]
MGDNILNQHEQLIPYRKGDKYGFCDRNKNIIIKPQYDRAGLFGNGYSIVAINGNRGIINTSGDIIIPFDPFYKSSITTNLFKVSKEYEGETVWGVVNLNREEILPLKFDDIKYRYGNFELEDLHGKKGVANLKGKIIIPVEYEHIEYKGKNLYVIYKGRKKGLFTIEGKQLTDFEYTRVKDFSDGLAQVEKNTSDDEKSLYGYIDTTGKVIGKIEYEDNSPFYGGFGVVKQNGKYGLIDKQGNIKIETKYDDLEGVYNGVALFQSNGFWGIVSIDGKEILEAQYEKIYFLHKDILVAKHKNKWGLISNKGKKQTEFIFDEIETLASYSFRLYRYDRHNFDEGYLSVSKGSKWGVINAKGEIVIPIHYDRILSFVKDIAVVQKGDKYGLKSVKGLADTEIVYDNINPISSKDHAMIFIFRKDKKLGFLNKTGKEISPAIYDEIEPENNGYYVVTKSGKVGIFNVESGKETTQCIYDRILKAASTASDYISLIEIAQLFHNGKILYIDNNGQEFFE